MLVFVVAVVFYKYTVDPLSLDFESIVENPQLRADCMHCSTPPYTKDLSIHIFWYPWKWQSRAGPETNLSKILRDNWKVNSYM